MTNNEAPMTSECLNDESRTIRDSSFGFRHSFVIQISSFVIHSLIACCLLSDLLFAATVTPTTSGPIGDPEKAGAELVQKLRAMSPEQNSKASGVLKIRDREGQTRDVPVSCQVLAKGKTWQVTYEAKPTGTSSVEKLTILHTLDRPNEYLYTKAGDSEAQKLSGQKAMIPFAGSDFWLSDLGLEFLHWPKQRLLKTEMRKSRWCNVLQSDNPLPTAAGYGQVISWLDKESGGPILAQGYDRAGKLLKEFSIRSLKKVEGQWQLEEMEIISKETKSRTRLEFDLETR